MSVICVFNLRCFYIRGTSTRETKVMVSWDVVLCTLVGDTVMKEPATFVFRVEIMGGASPEMLVQNRRP